MAVNPRLVADYSGQIDVTDLTNYPYGKAQNITTPGDGTGTPWDQLLINDIFGMQQAILTSAGITPSGSPDTVQSSQYLEAIRAIAKAAAIGGYNVGDIITTALASAPEGSFALDGSTVTNMRTLYPDLWASSANGVFFTASGDDGVLLDDIDFHRGKGSSSRAVGEFQIDSLGSHRHNNGVGTFFGGNVDPHIYGRTSEDTPGSAASRATEIGGRPDSQGFTSTEGSAQTAPRSITVLNCLYHGVFA